jgi:hypothetical protein
VSTHATDRVRGRHSPIWLQGTLENGDCNVDPSIGQPEQSVSRSTREGKKMITPQQNERFRRLADKQRAVDAKLARWFGLTLKSAEPQPPSVGGLLQRRQWNLHYNFPLAAADAEIRQVDLPDGVIHLAVKADPPTLEVELSASHAAHPLVYLRLTDGEGGLVVSGYVGLFEGGGTSNLMGSVALTQLEPDFHLEGWKDCQISIIEQDPDRIEPSAADLLVRSLFANHPSGQQKIRLVLKRLGRDPETVG